MVHGVGDTIAAIATARGAAALAIVRLSGPAAIEVADRCFKGVRLSDALSHTAHVGFVLDESGEALDQVVATIFRAPRSSTGEDVVEITCHGGNLMPATVLSRLLESGARIAQPGEFTQRAFLNGKLDLAQAEAVADIIHASSSAAQRVSMAHLRGRYSSLLQSLRNELIELAAFLELELDFSEEDVAFADRERLVCLVEEGRELIRRLLASYRTGTMLRDGVGVVIGGRPNAGKSTLLNALVGHDRAIVSEHPGTTRDAVDADVELDGIRFRFTDTAGIRETRDLIEAEGVNRAHDSFARADVLVYVYDLSIGLDAGERAMLSDLQQERPNLPIFVIGNKSDIAKDGDLARDLPPYHIRLSAARARDDESEVEPVVSRLIEIAGTDHVSADASAIVMNERHRQHLARALEALDATSRSLQDDVGSDFVALDLRRALDEMGAITGAVTTEDVLDQIFSRFCIGK